MDFEEIKQRIRKKKYLITAHAEEEMVKDGLTTKDLEEEWEHGKIRKRRKHD